LRIGNSGERESGKNQREKTKIMGNGRIKTEETVRVIPGRKGRKEIKKAKKNERKAIERNLRGKSN